MKNILIPTDFSTNAFHALRYTTELLKDTECNFFLLNVYGGIKGFKSKLMEVDDQKFWDKKKKESETCLKTTLRRLKKEMNIPKHKHILISKQNDLIKVIHDLVDELKIDLMVLSNKGETSSIPIFLGSTTTKTLESIKKCPVLTVPREAEIGHPTEIAFATDFKKRFKAHTLDPIRSMAALCKAAIRIVYINEKEALNDLQKRNMDSLLTYFGPLAYSIDRIPNFVSKTKIIQLFMESSGIGMLAMVNYEYGFLEKMLREPVVEKMILKINLPFFILFDTD